MSKKERIIIILLASINFTHILDFMIMMPLGNYLMPSFDISPRQFSILLASYPISSFVAGIVMFFLADGFERKKLLLTTYVGFVIGTAAVLCQWRARPARLTVGVQPFAGAGVMHMVCIVQCNEHIDVQQCTHQMPSASRRRA